MGFFNSFFNMFKSKNDKSNNTASNSELANMKDTHVSLGEDPGSLENLEDEEK